MARITVLGLGAMGSRMAGLLLKAGHEVPFRIETPENIRVSSRKALSPRYRPFH